MEQAARVKEIKHLHRKRTQKCLFSEVRPNGQKDGQGKYLWSKSILQNRPQFGGKPKEGGASKKVLHAQKHFP